MDIVVRIPQDAGEALRGPPRLLILCLTLDGRSPSEGRRGWTVDRDLVLRAQRGEESALGALVQRFGNTMHATAHHILRDPDLAADAVQQAMIDIWRKLPQLRDPEAFTGWAYRIVVRAALAEGRAHAVRRTRIEPISEEGHPSADPSGDVHDRDELERGFARLGLEHRAVVVLKHYAGLSIGEIATAMDIPEGTVRSRLFNAIQALRAAVEADRRVDQDAPR
jgi:RNA polymerase sigma-70 factor, ECF subfamily